MEEIQRLQRGLRKRTLQRRSDKEAEDIGTKLFFINGNSRFQFELHLCNLLRTNMSHLELKCILGSSSRGRSRGRGWGY